MAKTTVPGLYIADSAITAAKLNSTLDLTGKTITVATASSGDNDTTVASTAFVQQEIASLVDSSPSALNTLNELAAAIGDDANFSTTVTNSIATKLALAGGTMTGDLIINTTGALQIPVGTTAQRPTAATGQFRFNSSTSKAEIYDGSSWSDVGGGVESVNSNTGAVTLDTDDISEGSSNLYFTNARADARIAAATTDDLTEGSTNLYFTTARANSAIDGRLSGSTGVTVSNGAISIGQDVATSTSPTFQNLTLSGTDSIKVPAGTTAQRSGSPANGMLRYNSTNGEFEGYQSGAWGALGGDTTSSVDLYTATGNGSTATYDTGKNPQSENNTWVFIGGVYQPKSTYSYSGTQITLSENLPNGEDLEVITGTVSTYNPTDAILGQYNTTTSNTASYDTSLTTENENNVFVFIDGVYQPKSSYTYSGSTLTLDATPTSGMSLEVLVTRSMNAATVTTGFLADDAVTTAKITDANVTAAKLASSLDLTGKTVTVATASSGDNDTSVASTAFVQQEITSLVDSAPATLNTLNELAAALGDDANFSTTVTNSIATKLPLSGGTLTGALTTNGVINTGTSHNFAINTPNSLRINIDSNDSATDQVFVIGKNQTGVDASNNVLFKIGEDGKAGIGVGGPNANLHIGSAAATGDATNPALQIGGASTYRLGMYTSTEGAVIANANGDDGLQFVVKTAGEAMRIDGGTGNVGIGVTSPTATLDVNGTIKLDGNYPVGTGNVALGDTALDSIESGGNYNVAIGRNAATATTTGDNNIAIGNSSLDANTTGTGNVAVGGDALGANTTASNNTAVGTSALLSNTTGTQNVAVGSTALDANTTASGNTALGYSSLSATTTGDRNTAVGWSAMSVNVDGDRGVAVGYAALQNQEPSSASDTYNVAVGYNAANAITTGLRNTAVGGLALDALTTENDNVAVGYAALSTETTGFRNVAVGSQAGGAQNGGTNNTLVGYLAGGAITTGDANTFIGSDCGDATTTASSNTAVGQNAMGANTTGALNTVMGVSALATNTTGGNNVAIGFAALQLNTTATGNTAVGYAAMNANTTGTGNTAIGYQAGDALTSGNYNVAMGLDALGSTTTASNNVAIGVNAVRVNTTGTANVGVGRNALEQNTTASNNTAVGYNAMYANTTGYDNVAVGRNSLDANTTGHSNTAIGESALTSSTTANRNVAIGQNAMAVTTTGYENVAIGRNALDANTTGYANVAIGDNALTSSTTRLGNVAVGYQAAQDIDTTGVVAIGYRALMNSSSGYDTVAIGANALYSNSTGHNNVGIGYNALYTNSSGLYNIAIGSNALDSNTTANNNVAIGYNALTDCTTGAGNVAISIAGINITTGYDNVAVGSEAMEDATTGHSNTCVGRLAGQSITSGSNNLLLGHHAGRADSPGGNYTSHSNRINLGDNSIIEAAIKVSWTVTSDKRDKADVEPLRLGLDFVNKLEPVTYRWDMRSDYSLDLDVTPDGTHKKPKLHGGLLAQDVEELEREYGYKVENETAVITNKNVDGNYGLQYEKFVPVLINAIKELKTELDAAKARITELEG